MNEVITKKELKPHQIRMLEARKALSPERRREIASLAGKGRKQREIERLQKAKEEFDNKSKFGKLTTILGNVADEEIKYGNEKYSYFEAIVRSGFKDALYSDDLGEKRKFIETILNYRGEKPRDQLDITTTSFMRIQQQFMPVALKVVGDTEAINGEVIDNDKLLEAEPIGVSDSEVEPYNEE